MEVLEHEVVADDAASRLSVERLLDLDDVGALPGGHLAEDPVDLLGGAEAQLVAVLGGEVGLPRLAVAAQRLERPAPREVPVGVGVVKGHGGVELRQRARGVAGFERPPAGRETAAPGLRVHLRPVAARERRLVALVGDHRADEDRHPGPAVLPQQGPQVGAVLRETAPVEG